MIKFLLASLFLSVSAFAAETTIEGKIVKVVPAKKEIYVEMDGKKHEFYFTPTTTFTKGTEAAKFEDLQTGMTVKVVADKKGKRYDPKSVEIVGETTTK